MKPKLPRTFGVPRGLPLPNPANVIALIVGTVILGSGIAIIVPLASQAAEARAAADAIDSTRQQLHEWQSVAPGVIRDEAKAQADLRPYCGLGSDLNRVLLQIADHVSRAHVRVSQGDYKVDPLVTLQPTSTSPVASSPTSAPTQAASPTPSAPPLGPGPGAGNTPSIVDGIASISKSLSLEGRYPDIVRAIASVDDLHYPATAVISSVTRKSETTVTVVIAVTVRVPLPSVCSDPLAPGPRPAAHRLPPTHSQTSGAAAS